jgi:DNA-binding NtrC family response regulator
MFKSNSTRRKKALIIDDETDICYLLSSILQQKNIQAVFAGSLNETDKIMQSADSFGYIFIDNHLPDGLGSTYIEKIRNRFPETKLIMITAHDTNSERKQAVENGVDYFIGKPFSKEKILETVELAKTGT